MKTKSALIIIYFIATSAFAIIQFDTKGFYSFTEKESGADALNRQIGKVESCIYAAEGEFSSGTSFYLTHRIDGALSNNGMAEQQIPFDNFTALGLQFTKKHTFSMNITYDIFSRADELYLNFYNLDTTIVQKQLSSGNVYLHLHGEKTEFSADITYFRLNYDLQYGDNGITKAIDDDMWSNINYTINLNDDLRIALGTILKNDFNSYSGYDYGDHHIDIIGEHLIRMKTRRLYLTWLLSERWRISEAMYLNGDAEGLATLIYLRPVFKLRKRIFLKGIVHLDLSKKMQKQRYELILRKSWKNRSSVDIGYWNILGSVFQRQGSGIKTVFFLGKKSKFGLSSNMQLFWRQDINKTAYRYYRTTLSFETLFNVFKRAEIVCGYSYSHYINLLPFTNRGTLYLGMKKW